jgi:hypothetical protein
MGAVRPLLEVASAMGQVHVLSLPNDVLGGRESAPIL